MANASKSALYSDIKIHKTVKSGKASSKRKTADLKGKIIDFNYYESLYSPMVTATATFIDAGGSVDADKAQDSNERKTSIKDGLPITGLETVDVDIEHTSGKLIIKYGDLTVNSAPTIVQEGNRSAVFLYMTSNLGIKNSKTPLNRKYKGKISDTVKKLMGDYISPKVKFDVDETKNSYNFITKNEGFLDIVNSLCRKSVPVKGDPGYFFYQNQNGYNFKSIDNLISEGKEKMSNDGYKSTHTYTYSGAIKADDENDFKILRPPLISKDQDVIDAVKDGTYSSRNVFLDPRTLEKTEQIFKLGQDGPTSTLGKKSDIAGELEDGGKVTFMVEDVGSLEEDPSIIQNNSPREWQAKSRMRYKLLHSQMVTIQVPCNLELVVGDLVRCEFEFPGEKKEEGVASQQQSGNYLILHLCHHFDPNRSYTSMTLARDTYGLHTK